MKKITQQDIDTLSLSKKEIILKELHQENLIELFKRSYKQSYKPIEQKSAVLDQQMAMSITEEERNYLRDELTAIRRVGEPISISSFVRNKIVNQVDIQEWKEHALEGLRILASPEYDENTLIKSKRRLIKQIDNIDDEQEDARESYRLYHNQLNEISEKLEKIQKIKPSRAYRLTGRVTFSEANIIRWRASRLNITIADYIRLVLFDYLPNSQGDKHISIETRKRFYISILEIAKNGWGNPPTINECPNCARYIKDIERLKQQLERYSMLEKSRRG